jgi:hypothetical protein
MALKNLNVTDQAINSFLVVTNKLKKINLSQLIVFIENKSKSLVKL